MRVHRSNEDAKSDNMFLQHKCCDAESEITTLPLSVLLLMLLFSLLLLLLSLLLQLLIVVAASRCRCRSCLCEGYDMRLHRSNEDAKSDNMFL